MDSDSENKWMTENVFHFNDLRRRLIDKRDSFLSTNDDWLIHLMLVQYQLLVWYFLLKIFSWVVESTLCSENFYVIGNDRLDVGCFSFNSSTTIKLLRIVMSWIESTFVSISIAQKLFSLVVKWSNEWNMAETLAEILEYKWSY